MVYFHLLHTQGISTTIVLVRVEMGVSYGNVTSSKANPGHPTQLTYMITDPGRRGMRDQKLLHRWQDGKRD